jgi:hypothetical protein
LNPTVGTNSIGVPTSNDNKKQKRLSYSKTQPTSNRTPGPSRTRPARRSASTALRLRLVRGTLDGNASTASHPAPRSTSIALRLAQGSSARRKGSGSRDPGSEGSIHSLHLTQTKFRAFNAITYSHSPAWPQLGSTWEQRRCQPSLFYYPSRDGK